MTDAPPPGSEVWSAPAGSPAQAATPTPGPPPYAAPWAWTEPAWGPPAQRGRSPLLVAGVVIGAALVAVLALGLAAAAVFGAFFFSTGEAGEGDGGDVRTDAAELELTETRLRDLGDELDSLQVASADDDDSSLEPCFGDLGFVQQPTTYRSWFLGDGEDADDSTERAAAQDVARQLQAAGWSGSTLLSSTGTTVLSRTRDGWTAVVQVDAYPGSVDLSGSVAGATPCTASGE